MAPSLVDGLLQVSLDRGHYPHYLLLGCLQFLLQRDQLLGCPLGRLQLPRAGDRLIKIKPHMLQHRDIPVRVDLHGIEPIKVSVYQAIDYILVVGKVVEGLHYPFAAGKRFRQPWRLIPGGRRAPLPLFDGSGGLGSMVDALARSALASCAGES